MWSWVKGRGRDMRGWTRGHEEGSARRDGENGGRQWRPLALAAGVVVPDGGELPGVVVVGFVEELVVGDGADAAGVLAGADPHAGVGLFVDAAGLAHFQEGSLEEAELDDVTADAANGDAAADGE